MVPVAVVLDNVAEHETAWLTREGLGLQASVMVRVAGWTVCEKTAEVPAALLASPL
jgi:hypothetical protein